MACTQAQPRCPPESVCLLHLRHRDRPTTRLVEPRTCFAAGCQHEQQFYPVGATPIRRHGQQHPRGRYSSLWVASRTMRHRPRSRVEQVTLNRWVRGVLPPCPSHQRLVRQRRWSAETATACLPGQRCSAASSTAIRADHRMTAYECASAATGLFSGAESHPLTTLNPAITAWRRIGMGILPFRPGIGLSSRAALGGVFGTASAAAEEAVAVLFGHPAPNPEEIGRAAGRERVL